MVSDERDHPMVDLFGSIGLLIDGPKKGSILIYFGGFILGPMFEPFWHFETLNLVPRCFDSDSIFLAHTPDSSSMWFSW